MKGTVTGVAIRGYPGGVIQSLGTSRPRPAYGPTFTSPNPKF